MCVTIRHGAGPPPFPQKYKSARNVTSAGALLEFAPVTYKVTIPVALQIARTTMCKHLEGGPG